MEKISQLKFKYRGSRAYIHGPDIYKEVSAIIPDGIKASVTSAQLSCNRLMHKNATATTEWEREGVADSVFTVKSNVEGQSPSTLYISEIDEEPEERVPYDEDRATDGWIFDEDEGSALLVSPNPEYTVLQTVVAINKVFLSKLNGNPQGKWIFARVKGPGFFPATCDSIKLISKPTRSLRLVRSKIEIDGDPFGEIYFSLT